MRALIQRVSHASVTVEGECVGKIEKGLLVLLGVGPQDTEKQADFLAEKCANLRIFVDENLVLTGLNRILQENANI